MGAAGLGTGSSRRSTRCLRHGSRGRSRRCFGTLLLLASLARHHFALLGLVAADFCSNLVDALRRPLFALCLVEHFLLLAQTIHRLAPVAFGLIETRRDHESLAALAFLR